MRTTVAEIESEIETRKQDLVAARQRERADKLRPLQTAVERAADAITRHATRVAWAEQRITQLQNTVLVLASKEDSKLGTLLTECYTSMACLRAMIDDAERVTEALENQRVAAVAALNNASK